jgi:hypothetical protein
MITENEKNTDKDNPQIAYIPTEQEQEAYSEVIKNVVKGRTIIQKSYNQFNDRSLYDAIDDWQMRWNGYITSGSVLDENRSRIFLNYTRNLIINYLSKVALNLPKIKVLAVNNKSGFQDQSFARMISDLNDYSNNAENADARFFESCLEVAVKGTVIRYEGYSKQEQETEIADEFDAETGEYKKKKIKRLIYDDCYQELVATEDFYIANPYQPAVQKQPWIVWRKITTYQEAQTEFGHYENFKYVKPGSYTVSADSTTFYRNQLMTEVNMDSVDIVRYYNRGKNRHVVLISGVPVYMGPIPFKDGKYPFAKGIHEPYDNNFFWGASFVQKIMGDQDLLNTLWNLIIDKSEGSLSPFGLTSDLDDMVEDLELEPNKIRKVGDITKWRFESLPGVSGGEMGVLGEGLSFIKELSGSLMAPKFSPKGGKLNDKQLQQQEEEMMMKLGFTSNLLEDFERDRTELRINHILQFYSIPKMEAVTGKDGKEIQELMYREIKIPDATLSNGQTGTKIIKLVGDVKTKDKRKKLEDEMSVIEATGEHMGIPTEVIAVPINTFYDYNYRIQIVRNSSFEKTQSIENAKRMAYANWRLSLAQVSPVDTDKLIQWVENSFDIEEGQFKPTPSQKQAQQQQALQAMQGGEGGAPGQPPGGQPMPGQQGQSPQQPQPVKLPTK